MSYARTSPAEPGAGFGEKFAGWSLIASMPLALYGFIFLTDFVPPPPPTWSAEEIAAHYRENAFEMRLASLVFMFVIALQWAYMGAASGAMLRMRGRHYSLIFMQIIGGLATSMTFFLWTFFWVAAAFRPERSDEEILLLNDIAWLMLILPGPPGLVQMGAFALAILFDDRENPVLPRWLAYLTIWVAILFSGGIAAALFKTGPFAWNGLFAFYLPLTAGFFWFACLGWQFIKLGGRLSRGEL